MPNTVNLIAQAALDGVRRSNRAIGGYYESLGCTVVLPATSQVAVFDATPQTVLVQESSGAIADCSAKIQSFADTPGQIKCSMPISAGDVMARYYPSRQDDGLSGCVMFGEVDAMTQGSMLLVAAMMLHQRTAAACGLDALPLQVHIARLVLRGRDAGLEMAQLACVVGGQLRLISASVL